MSSPENIRPPQWPLRLLRFFLKKEYLEEIEGDMEEIFYEGVKHSSLSKARRKYAIEMLKLLRPILMQNFEGVQRMNQYGMFKNYFKVSLRGLMKNPLNSSINIIGLAAAIGFCVFAYGFAQWAIRFDQFHTNKDVVFLTTFSANRDGNLQRYGSSPRPLGELLKQDFGQVVKMCRIEDRPAIVKFADNVFNERIRFTDPAFLEMFTFPLKWGTIASLSDVNSIIISERMSIKYFGEMNPIGQSILVRFDKERSKPFKVAGVAEAFPTSRSMEFNFLVNYENFRTEPGYDLHDWTKFVQATFVQVADSADINTIQLGMEKYRSLQNAAVEEDWAIASFAFEPLADMHMKTDDIRNDIFREGSQSNSHSLVYLSIVAAFMLALACFNYINIAIVSAARRLKELGVRKSLGATRKVVIVQFLSENIITTGSALIIGLVLGVTLIIPWFENLWGMDMAFRLDSPDLWIYLPLVMLITGIASGFYPALYISRFQAVDILKGSVRFGSRNLVTKVFLGAQLILTSIFMTSAVMFTQNSDYLAHRSWGYSHSDVMYTPVEDQQAYEKLHALMVRTHGVISVSGSTHHVGKNHGTAIIHFPDRDFESDLMSVDANYFATMGLSLSAGRGFNDHEGSDRQAVVVNQEFVKSLAWEKPVGQQFKIDTTMYEVVGVVKDFHSYSFAEHQRPLIFRVADKAEFRYLSMKVNSGSEKEAFQSLQAGWAELFPDTPFTGNFQDDVWGFYFEEIEIHGHVWRVFATIAVMLASLGLYGLVSFNVAGRTKEFSIRKVLGAGMKNLATNISNQYVFLFAIALILGAPLSFFLIKTLLDMSYPYHMPITFWSTALASTILVLVLLATISTQIWKVSKANPVSGLKVD